MELCPYSKTGIPPGGGLKNTDSPRGTSNYETTRSMGGQLPSGFDLWTDERQKWKDEGATARCPERDRTGTLRDWEHYR